jgi:hypothetical protein
MPYELKTRWLEGFEHLEAPPEALAFARKHALASWLSEILWTLRIDILRALLAERENAEREESTPPAPATG